MHTHYSMYYTTQTHVHHYGHIPVYTFYLINTSVAIKCIVSSSCSWVKLDGDEYRLNSGVIVDISDDIPTIGVIQKIFVIDSKEIFFA